MSEKTRTLLIVVTPRGGGPRVERRIAIVDDLVPELLRKLAELPAPAKDITVYEQIFYCHNTYTDDMVVDLADFLHAISKPVN